VPQHWDSKRFKFVIAVNPRPTELRGFAPEAEVSFVPMKAIGEQGGLDLSRMQPFAEIANGYTYFRDGDVIVAKITPCFENGKGALAIALTNGIAFGTTELHVLRPNSLLHPQFLLYITLSDAFRRLGAAEMYGAGGQKRVPESFVENLRHPLPPIDEQRANVAFLDRETARIDALVAKKEQLIALLQEKRTALITRAVIKGLDPNSSMKDSGVEWLGEIPAHWEVKRLKYVLRPQKGAIKTGPFASQLKSSEMQAGEIKVYNQRSVIDCDFHGGENHAYPVDTQAYNW
jgi:type I restriction enzyme S subunit